MASASRNWLYVFMRCRHVNLCCINNADFASTWYSHFTETLHNHTSGFIVACILDCGHPVPPLAGFTPGVMWTGFTFGHSRHFNSRKKSPATPGNKNKRQIIFAVAQKDKDKFVAQNLLRIVDGFRELRRVITPLKQAEMQDNHAKRLRTLNEFLRWLNEAFYNSSESSISIPISIRRQHARMRWRCAVVEISQLLCMAYENQITICNEEQ